MLSGFTFEHPHPNYGFYSKTIGDYLLQFYVGDWGWDLNADSDPPDPLLNIEDYNYVYAEIIEDNGSLCPAHYEATFKIDKLGLEKHRANPVTSYSKITIAQLKAIHDALEVHQNLNTNSTAQVGGICSVCNLPDPWAYWKNGKCYCYSHTPGQGI
jgi:hypothetical protein